MPLAKSTIVEHTEVVELLGTLAVVGLCIALAAAGPSFLLYRAELQIEALRMRLDDRNRRIVEMRRESAPTRVWRIDERPEP